MSVEIERYPIEFAFPDIRQYAVGTGDISYLHTLDSGASGPHVMISCLTHGNEVCGAVVIADLLERGVKPRTGKLTFLFANPDAYHSFDEQKPDASRFVEEDLNRVWSSEKLDGAEQGSLEVLRARAIRPVVDSVDLLLDIHSMHEKSLPLCLSGSLEKGIDLAKAVACPATVIVDGGHSDGKRLRDYQDFGDADSQRNALLIECGQHWEKSSIVMAQRSVARFLLHANIVDTTDLPPEWLQPTTDSVDVIYVEGAVVAQSSDFHFVDAYTGLETIAKQGTAIGRDGGREIVTPHDDCVLIMPSLRQLRPGVTVVRFGRRAG